MDAILTLGVTRLVDEILSGRESIRSADWLLDQHQVRDLLSLAACYDQSLAEHARAPASIAAPAAVHVLWAQRDLGVWDWPSPRRSSAPVIGLREWDWLTYPWIYLFARSPAWAPRLCALGNGSGRRGASCVRCGSAICI